MADQQTKRTTEESLVILDGIVGRCLRDGRFAEAVLSNPEVALASYNLQKDEMDDFIALKRDYREEAAREWTEIRMTMPAHYRRL